MFLFHVEILDKIRRHTQSHMSFGAVIFPDPVMEYPVYQPSYWNWLNLPPVACGLPISFANELTSATDYLQSYSQCNECNYLALNQDSIFLPQ